MPLPLEAVVKLLSDSGIVSQGKLENFVPPKAHPKNAEELIAELVKQNQITKFQAQQIAAGKAKSLILGEYTILDRIGAGGMGQVYKALHRRMERTVAIKVLPPHTMKDAAAVARFQREVVAAAKLHHTNIVTAYDAGQAGNAHFLVMEYVEGQDLSALVKTNGPLALGAAVNYILQAARGLEFAHGEGVIHRDIKPSNLLLDKKGTVKILDMGLARIEAGGNAPTQAELTGSGAVMGTVDYMAPEQAKSTHTADARADIYSLGCSLYFLLAGEAIYGGETLIEKLLAHREDPIPNLQGVRPDVSEQLEAVYEKMVAKQVADRYQTMTEVIADLQACGIGGGFGGGAAGLGVAGTSLPSPSAGASNPLHPSPLVGEGSGMRGPVESSPSSSNSSFLKDAPQQTTHGTGTKATRGAKANAGGQGSKNKTLVVAGLSVLAVALLAGIVISMRSKEGTSTAKVAPPDIGAQVPNAGQSESSKPWNTPAFEAWKNQVAALNPTEQIKVVAKKLHELNRDLKLQYQLSYVSRSGRITEITLRGATGLNDLSPLQALSGLEKVGLNHSHPFADVSALQGLSLVSLDLSLTKVTDISALKGMPLENLELSSGVKDLSPLEGMPLTSLSTFANADLSPLRGMKLDRLEFDNCRIDDLSPLAGMPLTFLRCSRSRVRDLSPLRGMPLVTLDCSGCQLADLSPLEDCAALTTLKAKGTKVKAEDIAALQAKLPKCKIEWDDPMPAAVPK